MPFVRRKPVGTMVGCLLLLATVALVIPSSAAAARRHLVALGDSYASGVGTRTYFTASGSCQRSPYAYPVLEAHRIGAALTFAACAGATSAGVLHNQLSALSESTSDVTVTVGGNDAGFRSVLVTCAQPRWMSSCRRAIHAARVFIVDQLPALLDTLYQAVRLRAPGARIAIVGYPRLFDGEDCNAGTWFSPTEERQLNATADLLDRVIRARAVAHGFDFADPRSAFTGHAVCAPVEWINGLSAPLSESYHPNRQGQRGYAHLVRRTLG